MFSTRQPELWVRFYIRYEPGFTWDGLAFNKLLYFFSHDSSSQYEAITGIDDNRMTIGLQGGSDSESVPVASKVGGWDDWYKNGISSGKWYCIEVYLKMDNGNDNGIGRIWLDGILIAENKNVGWSNLDHSGYKKFCFHPNNAYPDNNRVMYVDYDEMVVYRQTPPNRDNSGNPMIGPIGTKNITIPAIRALLLKSFD